MRLILLPLILLLSNFTIAQTLTPAEKELSKSLDSFKRPEKLFEEIEDLERQITEQQISYRRLDYSMGDYERYQNMQRDFRDLLDLLELGIYRQDLNNYHSNIIRNYEGESTDTLFIVAIDTTNRLPSIDIRLFTKDSILVKRYPNVFKMIETGKIKIEFGPNVEQIAYSQAPRLEFPSLVLKSKDIAVKNEFAEVCLHFISEKARYKIDGDVIPVYLKLEQKLAPDNNLDKIIELRRNFIQYLKEVYDNQQKN